MSDNYDTTDRSRLRRRPQRGYYDRATVHAVLDSEVMAQLSYVVDGRPCITPTSYWREGDTLYWHGSRASRMIEAQAKGIEVAFCVARLDALVAGRTGFSHSVNYSSVIAYGRTRAIDTIDGKAAAMNAFIDRIYPGRAETLRPFQRSELAQIMVIAMPIEEAAAKIRNEGVRERDEDLPFPVWSGVLHVAPRITAFAADPRGTEQPLPAPINDLLQAPTLQDGLTRAAQS